MKSKETDRFITKLFRKKLNTQMSNKKEKVINTQNRILNATGPLDILWQEPEKLKSADKGIDPNDVINIVQRASVLIGNVHYIYMTDRRKTLLRKLLPESVDLIYDSSGKKPYVNQRTNSLKANLENYSLRTARITENCPSFLQQENVLNMTNMHLIRKPFSELMTDQQFFFGQGHRTTDSSLGVTITVGSSTREGGVTEEPPELRQQLQEKQRISKSGKLFEINVSQTNRGKYSYRGGE